MCGYVEKFNFFFGFNTGDNSGDLFKPRSELGPRAVEV